MSRRRRTQQRPRKRLWTLLVSWSAALVSVAAAAAVVGVWAVDPLEPTWPGLVLSLAADLAAQLLGLALVSAAVCLVCRRWLALHAVLLAVLVLITTLLDVPRAERARAGASGVPLRVLTLNSLARNRETAGVLGAILEAEADIVMINEPSREVLDALASDPRIAASYPHDTRPERVGPGYRYVMSRYALLEGEDGFGGAWPEVRELLGYHGQRLVRVETAAGPFVFAGVHFRSPRRPDRWAGGNLQAHEFAAGLAHVRAVTGLPMVVAGDFNASPTGRRSRDLGSAAGLRRTKPLLAFGGTFPAGLPGASAIDGVMATEAVGRVRWATIRVPGSDHDGVVVDLLLPGASAGAQSSP